MKNTITFTILATLLMSIPLQAQTEQYLKDIRHKWENAAQYTLEVLELMPEEHLDFKPTEEQKTFREQLLHTLQNAVWLSSSYLGGEKYEVNLEAQGRTKAELIELTKSTFAYTHQVLAELKPENLSEEVSFFTDQVKNKGQILSLLNDHHTHHRGQMIIYLRLKEIKPPRYRGW